MKEIRLNHEVMRECIRELNSLKSKCAKAECPKAPGSDMAVTGIRQSAELYEQFNESLETLIGETAQYLSQMVRDFEEVDENMAKEMKKGVKS